MDTESKWTTTPARDAEKTRELDHWEKLAIQVALEVLFQKWSSDPEGNGVIPYDLVNLAELKLDFSLLKSVRIAI